METKMQLWDSVCTTDPKHTKHVNQRGGFTAIDAQSQIQNATEQFGPFGMGWGVKERTIDIIGELIIYQSILWFNYEDNLGEFPIESSFHFIKNDRIDDDAVKKVATDALTKGLSRLGFNADVFLGKFDGNKYVKTDSQNDNSAVWFGKHDGKKWKDVPIDYLEYLVKGSKGNLSDRGQAAKNELDRRNIPPHTDDDLSF